MSARTALGAPLALSLVGHAALLAVLAGVGFLAERSRQRDVGNVIAVKRVAEHEGRAVRRQPLAIGEATLQQTPDALDEGVVALDTADPRYRPYLTGVKERIWERWSAPALPRGQVARGTLVVEFTLTRSGRLTASGVRESSGSEALDQAALAAVALAVPFTPLPASITGESMRVRARFVYD